MHADLVQTYATHACLLQVLELQGTELKLAHEAEKPSSFKCASFGASSLKERHLATGNYEGLAICCRILRLQM